MWGNLGLPAITPPPDQHEPGDHLHGQPDGLGHQGGQAPRPRPGRQGAAAAVFTDKDTFC